MQKLPDQATTSLTLRGPAFPRVTSTKATEDPENHGLRVGHAGKALRLLLASLAIFAVTVATTLAAQEGDATSEATVSAAGSDAAADPSPTTGTPSPDAATATPTAAPDGTPVVAPTVAPPGGNVLLLEVDGSINPAVAEYIADGLDVASEKGMRAMVIELDTPGGLVSTTQDIVKSLLGARVPVAVYVSPSGAGATSAGVFVTMAAHVAAMAPGTNIGAAHPVSAGGGDMGEDMRKKAENFVASMSRSIAEQRNRNAEWAEKAVRESVSITEREAVELNVVDLIASDLSDLLRQMDGRTVEVAGRDVELRTASSLVVRHQMRLGQKIINTLAEPQLAMLLMLAAIVGLYVEFSNPGLIFPGVIGAICLVLALATLQALPINYAGVALILLGVGLFVAELFVPSFGILGIGGIVAFVLGSMIIFEPPEGGMPGMEIDRTPLMATAAAAGVLMLAVAWLAAGAQRRVVTTGMDGMHGEIGEVRRVDEAAGRCKVFVHGEYWDAECEDAVQVGDSVEVVSAQGLRLKVRPRQA